jgi:RNA polymerase sigma-70 factor (ECF subfamily)
MRERESPEPLTGAQTGLTAVDLPRRAVSCGERRDHAPAALAEIDVLDERAPQPGRQSPGDESSSVIVGQTADHGLREYSVEPIHASFYDRNAYYPCAVPHDLPLQPLPRASTDDDDSTIARLVARGAAAYPAIPEPSALRERLGASLALGSSDLEARAADLYLATACIAGDATAITVLESLLPAVIRPALARLGVPISDDDEIVQRVRVALLVKGAGGACGLAGYSGRGELRAYVRSVAVRLALKRIEREGPTSDERSDLLPWLPSAQDSPELALLKHRCRDDVRTGFANALATLTARERTLLRQHYLDGLTVDMLAPLYQVHRSTCARWIDAARVKLLRDVRKHLRARLDLDDAELDSAVDLVRSQLDLSLCRHLASRDA